MQEITVETALQLGLTAEEFARIEQLLGRKPNFTELSMFSVMWSEHCSYKNSIRWLKTLPREGERLLAKAGEENAGLVDIGEGYACVFKIESHNHPSAIEPFQGAATGVGGIHRDIFTMGARPIAALNSLRFGEITESKTRHLLRGVVAGIGHYGNCLGVATVGGEVYFDTCYHTNPLVNAMSVGLVKIGSTVSAIATGEGNPVMIVGSETGKDGIGGAAFASANITEDSVEDLPAVQVGDPFQEKKLLEACLEAVATGALIGMQDMGAAGITCSTSEMSAKGNHGMRIDLSRVPTRQPGMKAWEILISESQERMLIVVKKGREEEVRKIFEKWDLHCVQIGEVTREPQLQFYFQGKLEASVPADSLVVGGGAPVYEREYRRPSYLDACQSFEINSLPEPSAQELLELAKALTSLPTLASKKWIYEQYDRLVGTANISAYAPADAALVWAKPTSKILALTTDCNSLYVFADPCKGTQIAVAEAARNIACSGGKPLAITNCLNFGNPYDPEVYYQFVQAIQGMRTACEAFRTPVTGGNVSFYNQSPDGPVYPTPVIGMLGLLESRDDIMTLHFKQPGDRIYLLGQSRNDVGCSAYVYALKKIRYSNCPFFDLQEELQLQQLLQQLIQARLIRSAHDVSEGGLWIALLESAMAARLGMQVQSDPAFRKDAFWFGESQSRVVVSVSADKEKNFLQAIQHFPHRLLGEVRADQQLWVDGQCWGELSVWTKAYEETIARYMETDTADIHSFF
ncbi:MAG: phosphoribosylformylglycinamidine synthase subunit PurL [Thermoflavifilum aggregans]|nr:phosphoribosylformylglycinamidine synthase subunit PurL [Thermoflavifilum aggregans]